MWPAAIFTKVKREHIPRNFTTTLIKITMRYKPSKTAVKQTLPRPTEVSAYCLFFLDYGGSSESPRCFGLDGSLYDNGAS